MLVRVTKQTHEQKITHWLDTVYPTQLTEVQAKIKVIDSVLSKKQKRSVWLQFDLHDWLDDLHDHHAALCSRYKTLCQLLDAIEQYPDGVLMDYHLVEDML